MWVHRLSWVVVLLLACSGASDGADSGGDRSSDAGAVGTATAGGDRDGVAGASGADRSGAAPAFESVARRLTRAELDNSLRDLLGDGTAPASQLLPEDPFAPFDNDYTQQQASAALIDSLERLAEEVAVRVLSDAATRAALIPCTPSGPDDAACFREVIAELSRKLLRRPPSDAETDSYLELLRFATEDVPGVDNGFDTAVELVIRALVFDPEFLYRIESGQPTDDPRIFALDDHAIAARISYLLWGSAPDAALRAAAEAGELQDSAARRAQAQRLLADDRARAQLHRFHAMWLGYRAVPHPAELTAAFNMETTALLDRILFDEPQSYLNLFTSEQTYLDEFLADHYGLSRPADGEGWVDYGDSGRAGLLSHGSVLAAFSKFSDTSPTQRGIMVRTRLMCQAIPPPPANVNADQPPGGDMEAACKEERYALHRSSPSCAGCHSQMDPIGFGLENYDNAGRFREHDDGLPECTISGAGELVPYANFSGPAELGRLLVDEGIIGDCVVEQLLAFALGRAPLAAEEAALAGLQGDFAAGDYRVAALLEDFVASDAFALRKEPEAP
ncbi:MAG: DUF1588 domain-containing protein [Myxococcales bacterium]|nr:DUF1588 domain-containing protein [Myxococcales bacterium]